MNCNKNTKKKKYCINNKKNNKNKKKLIKGTLQNKTGHYKETYQKSGHTIKIKPTIKPTIKVTAFFAGGCFWGIEKKFSELNGVLETQVGYMGGNYENPTYEKVYSGKTGHLETVKVIYDPHLITYSILVNFFIKIRDKKYYKHKTQYHSAIFYTNYQKKQLKKLKLLNREQFQSIKLLPITKFYIAEDYHQKYYFQKPCTRLNTEDFNTFKTICKNNSHKAEPKYKGKYLFTRNEGVYSCACCGTNLYNSKDKYDSGSGWPAFFSFISDKRLLFNPVSKELRCATCGLHLGHRTFDGPTETNIHDCINSVCLSFGLTPKSTKVPHNQK